MESLKFFILIVFYVINCQGQTDGPLGCMSNFDCNYHGNCSFTQCKCLPEWSGEHCSIPVSTTAFLETTEHAWFLPDVPPDSQGPIEFFDGGYKLYWKLYPDKQQIEISMVANGVGWVGFGIGPGMKSSDVALGWVSDGVVYMSDRYSFHISDTPRIDEIDNILAFAGKQENGVTTIRYLRDLVTGDVIYDRDIVPGDIFASVAYQSETINPHFAHDLGHRLLFEINFFTGKTSQVVDLLIVHGFFMGIAWAIFVPVTYALARFFKKYTWWFPFHIGINVFAIVLMIIGLVLAIYNNPNNFVGVPFMAAAHSWCGLFILAGAFFQPFLGWYADKKYNPSRKTAPFWPDGVHGLIGKACMILALIDIYLGMSSYEISYIYQSLYIFWMIFLVIAEIFFEFRKKKYPDLQHQSLIHKPIEMKSLEEEPSKNEEVAYFEEKSLN